MICLSSRSRRPAWLGGALVLAVLSLLLANGGSPVHGHANVAISDPAPETEFEKAPQRILIQYTEPIEERFSSIKVLDTNGAKVDGGDSSLDATDPRVMSVSLADIPDGTYTVSWVNVSTVDGHRVTGAFLFSVGEPISASAPIDDSPILASQKEPFIRWAVLAGALMAAGAVAFRAFILSPSLASIAGNPVIASLREAMFRRGAMVGLAGVLIAAVGTLIQLIDQTATTFGVGFFDAFGGGLKTIAFDTDWGREWLVRAVAISVLGIGLWMLASAPDRRWIGRNGARYAHLIMLAPATVLLLSLARVSHGAGTAGLSGTGTMLDFIHLMAASLWAGGIFQMAAVLPVILRHRKEAAVRRVLVHTVPRFSAAALLSGAVLMMTGSASAWAQLSTWDAFTTPYGYALLAKLSAIALLVMIAGVNLLWVRPRLSRAVGPAAMNLKRLLAGEAIVVLLVLLATGYLTALEPGRQVASRDAAAEGPVLTETDEGTTIRTAIEHSRVGANRIEVALTDRRGERVTDASSVELIITGTGTGIPAELVRPADVGNGTWVVESQRFTVAGEWQVETIVRRPGNFDARTAFRFDIGGIGDGSSSLFAPSPRTAALLLGGVVLATGVLFLLFSLPLGSIYTRSGLSVAGPGAALAVVGVIVIGVNFGGGGADTSGLRNPFPPTGTSVDIGRDSYVATCAACHGLSGAGDGPSAPTLSSRPADLTIHVPLHRDGDLFGFMRDGIAGTDMRPLGDALTEDEMWHVVNYLRSLAADNRD